MADNKPGGKPGGPPAVVPWERLSIFIIGKGQATLMRGCGIALLLTAVFIVFGAFLWMVATNGEALLLSGGLVGLAFALFGIFVWMWREAKDVIDDELYEPIVTEEPGRRPSLQPQPSPSQIESEPTIDAQYTLSDSETKV